jgi:outer membrane protein assembly factor BamD
MRQDHNLFSLRLRSGRTLSTLTVAVLLLLLLSACGRSYDSRGLSQEGLVALADEAFDNADYRDASDLFLELIYKFPGSSSIDYYLYMLGRSYSMYRQWVDAEFYLRRVVEDHPRSAWADDAQLDIARLFWNQRRDYRKDQRPVDNALTEVYVLMDSYSGSLLMEEAEALRDSCFEHLARRAVFVGEFYARRDLFDAARLYLREAVNDYGTTTVTVRALIDLGDIYAERGETYEARDYYERALEQDAVSEEERERAEQALQALQN